MFDKIIVGLSGRIIFMGVIVIGILFLAAATGSATIINVPDDYPTIQGGIDAAAYFDTVLVAPGHYVENINFRGKYIVLTSHFMYDHNTDYIFNTIIDGSNQTHPDTGSTVSMYLTGAYTILQGFTITGGTGTLYEWTTNTYDRAGGGVYLRNSTATVQYNYIVGNKSTDDEGIYSAGGGGVKVLSGNATVKNNIIVHNEGRYGAGLSIGLCAPIIKNNVIAYNRGGQKYPGTAIQINQGGSALIENNTIWGNVSVLSGAAIGVVGATPTIRNNIIWHNEGPSPHIDGYTHADYCNIEINTVTGTGNISVEPHLSQADWLYPYGDSPDIDAGNPDAVYYDIENPASPGTANWPAFGGLRNDMGAYGGQGAFPFHAAKIYADPIAGNVPIGVSFEGHAVQEIDEWIWAFADGDSSFIQDPSYVFDTPGQYDVILKAVNASGDTLANSQSIYALADTIKGENIEINVTTSNQIEVMINLTNNVPVREIQLPIAYSGDIDMEYNSFNTTGCRTESYSGITVTMDEPNNTLVFDIKSDLENPEYLSAGSGPVLAIVFDVVTWAPGTTTISLDGFDTTFCRLTGEGFDYMPEVIDGGITITYECGDATGDALVNLLDILYLISYLYDNPHGPAPVIFDSGDANADGNINLIDILYLISHLYDKPLGPEPQCP